MSVENARCEPEKIRMGFQIPTSETGTGNAGSRCLAFVSAQYEYLPANLTEISTEEVLTVVILSSNRICSTILRSTKQEVGP